MIKSILDKNVTEATELFQKMIGDFREEQDHCIVRGYLVMGENGGILQKKDLKKASAIDENGNPLSFHGSVKCGEPNEKIRRWMPILIAYMVKNNLMKELTAYHFEEFEISIECFPEYVYRSDKIVRYKRTGMILPYLKIYLKW